jgi:hypothetical protein
MDTPVESTDHALLRNGRVGRGGIAPLKATASSKDSVGVETMVQSQAQSRPAAATMPAGRQGEVEARHLRPIDSSTDAAQQLRRFDSRHHGPDA